MIDPSDPDYTNTPVVAGRPRFTYGLGAQAASPCVTIVTPFYNTGPMFHETAGSVLGQSLQTWEWLIVNDASNDPVSLSVLDAYRDLDPRIRVIDLDENSGPGKARNVAIRQAKTELVALLDSDDLLEPTALEKWAWFLVSHPEFAFVRGYTVGFGAMNYLWTRGYHTPKEFLRDNQIDSASMLRKSVHERVGGYNEMERSGLEDWEYWMHCADEGYWGDTIPEYLNWYRRRDSHTERWPNWDYGEKQSAFKAKLKERYPRLWSKGMPEIKKRAMHPNEGAPDELPFANPLTKDKSRLLMVVPWLTTGGADKFNLDLVEQLTARGWEITIATTMPDANSWLARFSHFTPDIFLLDNFLHLTDQPRFLKYLIESRQIDIVMISNSEMGYQLLPYLRSCFPEITYIDYCHMEEEYWKNGGYPRLAIEYQPLLDRNIVSSEHVKGWMVERGADASRVDVCYTNIDAQTWHPDPDQRLRVRRELAIADDLPVILFVGRILQQKQPEVLAKTLYALQERGTLFRAVIAGDGPDLEWLRTYVRKHSLQEAVFLSGVVSSQRVQEMMAAADIFFLPSRWEGLALVIYEAMASGLAVVGADVGGQRELLTPECGVLIPPGREEQQIQDYCNALDELIRDPEKRVAMGSAGRARVVERFTLDAMGDRMAALIDRARREHAAGDCPVVNPGLGRSLASQAVEYTRMARVAERLWAERRHRAHDHPAPDQQRLRERIYAALYRWHEPLYRWYSKRGFGWLAPIRNGLKRILMH